TEKEDRSWRCRNLPREDTLILSMRIEEGNRKNEEFMRKCQVLRRPGSFWNQFVHAMSDIFQLSLLDQFFPDGLWKLVRRADRHDIEALTAAERAAADVGFIIQARQLEAFPECLEGLLEVLR